MPWLVGLDLGTVHDRRLTMREKFILQELKSVDTEKFERARKFLGERLPRTPIGMKLAQ